MAILTGHERAPWASWRPVPGLSAAELEAEWHDLAASRDGIEGDLAAIAAKLRQLADGAIDDPGQARRAEDAYRHKALLLKAVNRRLQAIERRAAGLRRAGPGPASRRREARFIATARAALPGRLYDDLWRRADELAGRDDEEDG